MSHFLDNNQLCSNPFKLRNNYKCYSVVSVGKYKLYRYALYFDECRNGKSYFVFDNENYLFPIKAKTAKSCKSQSDLILLIEFKVNHKRLPHKGDILKRKKLDFNIQLPILL